MSISAVVFQGANQSVVVRRRESSSGFGPS